MLADPTFEQLLAEADQLAQANQWMPAHHCLIRAQALQPAHAGIANGLGTCLLRAGQPAEARAHFEQAAQLAPTQPEALNNLGVACVLSGDWQRAEQAYQGALALDPDHQPAWRNLAQLRLQQERFDEGVAMLASVVQAHPDDVEALLLLAGCYEQGDQAESALALYRRVLAVEAANPTATAAISRLAPAPSPKTALLKAHAAKLSGFRARPAANKPASIVFYCADEASAGVRVGVPAAALAAGGWRVKVPARYEPDDLQQHDLVVILRPNVNSGLMDVLTAATQAGKRVIVDLDEDFLAMPPEHPGYKTIGPGSPEACQRLERALATADLVTVPTLVLAERYEGRAKRLAIVPSGWSRSNRLWDKPAPHRRTINIGWAGTPTHGADVALVRRDLIRLLRDVPETQLVIAGDPEVYAAFSAVPETRRLYVPMMAFADYPYTLAYFDILLAPLRDTSFNRAKSDLKLLEAGIRRIPWVASDVPAYRAWGEGGLLATTDWLGPLGRLATDAQLRTTLGEAGRGKADTREARAIAAAWRAAVEPLLPKG
jgi:Flp pilus assembly protein TadD/glycosyltransferase involved in cell wall biosynthesis